MKTAADYLDEIKIKTNTPSDYAAAKLLGISKGAVSNYRRGFGDHFSDEVCEKVALMLEIDAEIVMLDAHIARAKTDSQRAAWGRLAQRLATAACAAGVFVVSGAPAPAEAMQNHALNGSPAGSDLYYVKLSRHD